MQQYRYPFHLSRMVTKWEKHKPENSSVFVVQETKMVIYPFMVNASFNNSWSEFGKHFHRDEENMKLVYLRTPTNVSVVLECDQDAKTGEPIFKFKVTNVFNQVTLNNLYNEVFILLYLNWHYEYFINRCDNWYTSKDILEYRSFFRKEFPIVITENLMVYDAINSIYEASLKFKDVEKFTSELSLKIIEQGLLDFVNENVMKYKVKTVLVYNNDTKPIKDYKRLRKNFTWFSNSIWYGIYQFTADLHTHLSDCEHREYANVYWDFYEYGFLMLPEVSYIKDKYFDRITDRYIKTVLAMAFIEIKQVVRTEIRDIVYAAERNYIYIRNNCDVRVDMRCYLKGQYFGWLKIITLINELIENSEDYYVDLKDDSLYDEIQAIIEDNDLIG